MSYQHFHFVDRLIELRVEDEHRQAAIRRLQSKARAARPDRAVRQRLRLLYQLGHLFPSMGQWLKEHSQRGGLAQQTPTSRGA